MPKKSLGQHFLTSERAIKRIIAAANIEKDENVLEIGPGKGVLTNALLDAGARVTAVEKDEALAAELKEYFADAVSEGRLTIITDDIQNFNLTNYKLQATSYKLIANIPYYITGAIIRTFLTAAHQPKAAVLLVQKEVAERIVARNGKESLLSLSVKAFSEPHIAGTVKRGSFNPPPQVDSAILVLTDISRTFFNDINEYSFFDVLRVGFGQKRKQLAGNLKSHHESDVVEHAFQQCNLKEKTRAEDLSLREFHCLAKHLSRAC